MTSHKAKTVATASGEVICLDMTSSHTYTNAHPHSGSQLEVVVLQSNEGAKKDNSFLHLREVFFNPYFE